jgi:hypothetical protein
MFDDDAVAEERICVVCRKRPLPKPGMLVRSKFEGENRVCSVCRASIIADLDAYTDLAVLMRAAVAPSLSQPIGRGARSAVTPMVGGDALNLVARSNAEVPLRFVPRVRIVPDEYQVQVDGRTVNVIIRRREIETDAAGRPVLVPDGDQHGDLGPGVMLEKWVEEWAAERDLGEEAPATGWDKTRWMLARIDWACRDYARLIFWVDELRAMIGTMRSILAIKTHVIRFSNRCPACQSACTLYRVVDPMMDPADPRTKYINCGACPTLFEVDDERIEAQAA